jgi:6,7-dimethyl-8-ribityllumazine synthase
MNISLEGFAIGYGILTVENYNQAIIRSKTIANKSIGKGKVAALACINQMRLKAKYTDGS